MWTHAQAIVWAQWRTVRNYMPRSNKVSLAFSFLVSSIWYGLFLAFAIFAAVILASPSEAETVRGILPYALLLCFLYWQLIPVLMASMGSSLDTKKLLVYPIPKRELFTLEVLLRMSTAIEMLVLLLGAGIGLLLNPDIPFWAPLALFFFVAFNLLCSAGVRDLLARLLARKRIRQLVVFLFALVAMLPQLVLVTNSEHRVRLIFNGEPSPFWPWSATAQLAQGEFSLRSLGILLTWTAAAYIFGRWQFERNLTFDAGEASARSAPAGRKASRLEWFHRLPGLILPDPLGALVEKELRFLSRAPRFQVVFLMGFTFGLLIWFPVAFGNRSSNHSLMTDNYLTVVSVYALLLLSDALFWNCFGFDRSAAQVYFLVPVKMSTVLIGKNLAAASFVAMEITAVALVCALLRLPFTATQVLEAVSVTVVVTLFLLTIGNLSSLYNPRSVNPIKSFRTASSGRTQAVLMLAFPACLIPVALAYLARYAFASEWAFFGVLLIAAAIGATTYSFSMESAVKLAEERKEQIIQRLSQGEGPIQN